MMTITRLRLRQTSRARLSSCITTEAVTAIQKYAAAYKKFNAAQLKYADVNKDGAVDINDATAVQKYIAGIIKSFD
ncbi:MAG: dockerin type I repeat-containing protein [Ruminococcus sp.]|nr:dockerin type I repeat-containing protein [Ruminococcus sp.]MBQ2441926.1 dockerin type I repeat-containing protein [Ruminococcus sp.]MBQ4172566.1 dockerin type I repeat-containing protein [Ruminococcus sp.]